MSSNGQIRIGIRSAIVTNSPIIPTTTISASLLQSLYGAWNGDTTTNELSTSLYGVWNGEYSGTASLETSLYGAWNGEALGTSLDTSIYRVYNGDNLNDTSGNSQNGTNVGGVTFTTGKVGNAFTFNGSNYVTLPDNSLNSLTGDFSISTWVNFTTLSGAKDILSSFTSFGGNYYGFELYTNGTGLKFSTFNGTTTYLLNDLLSTGTTLSTNTWYNIVITRKASTGTKMYINGTLNNSNTSTQNPVYATTNYATIGGSNFGASYVNLAASGTKIDAVSIWQKELTESEVVRIYNGGSGAEYPFSSQTLASSNDAVGTNHGTLTNGATLTTGKIGKAFTFDGINDYISLGDDKFNFPGNFSVSGWINFNSVSGTQCIFSNLSYNSSNISNGWLVLMRGQKLCLELYKNNGTYDQLASSTNLNTSTWYYITIVRVASQSTKIYINGVLDTSNTSTYDPTYLSTIPIPSSIGAWKYNATTISHFSNGKIEAINIWNKALTSNEVSMLYNGSNGTKYSSGSFGLTQSGLDSVGINHGTLINTTYGTGKIGTAFVGNGTNAYIQLPDNSLNLTGPFSYSFWIKATDTTGYTIIVGNQQSTRAPYGFGHGYSFWLQYGKITIGFRDGMDSPSYGLDSVATVANGQWNHVVITYKYTPVNTDGAKIYINGVLDSSRSVPNSTNFYSSPMKPAIGARNTSGVYEYFLSSGSSLDAMSVWNKELTKDEITQLYNSGTGAQYPFTGTYSSVGNQLGVDNGTLMNGATLTTGKVGKAFTFDGVNDYVALPDNSLNINSNFSVSAWVKYTIGSGIKTILSNNNLLTSPTRQYGWGLYLNSNNILFQTYDGTSTIGGLSYAATLTSGSWYHITVTKSGTTKRIYLNGAEVANASVNNITYTATHRPTIGGQRYDATGMEYFSVSPIDGLSVWQKELTQSEITELYNSGNGKQITTTPIVQSGLVLNLDASRTSSYPNTGTIWSDISGNGNNGTMTNGPVFGTANGGAITFDGVNDRITLQSANISATGNWTISSWFNLSSLPAVDINSNLYSQYISIPGNGRMILRLLNESGIVNKFQLFLGSGSGYSSQGITGTTTAQINTFYNLVGIRNGSVFSLYLNGNLEASLDLTGTNISILQTTPEIGGTISGNFGWLNGKIYNTLVYNRALSATEVTQNFNVTKSRFGL